MGDVAAVEELVGSLDEATAALVRPVLARLGRRGGPDGPTSQVVQEIIDSVPVPGSRVKARA